MTTKNNSLKLSKSQFKLSKKWKTSGIQISKRLRDIIHGYLMSDGYLRNGVLTVDQGKQQKTFVNWLYNEFELIRTNTPIKEVKRVHPKTQKTSISYRFFTRAVLQGFHHIWYKPVVNENGKTVYIKKLPKSIGCFFNETFISLWFAGDGTKIVDAVGAKFEVTAFTVEERLILKNLFLKKFNIKAVIISSGLSSAGNPQWALKIPANEYAKFRELITKEDLIPKIFPYKLHKKVF